MTTRTAITLADLAKIAGVSVATVSRSLAGNTVIAEATRTRIVALAQEHGFQVNQAARNLRLKRTGAIGVVLPLGHEAEQHLSDPFFMSLLGPLADAIADRGHDLLLSRVIPNDDRWLDAIVDGGRVDGLIVIGQSNQIEVIERVARRYRPMIVWGAGTPGRAQLTVGTDNVAGGRMAAEHLLAQGRTRLAFFGNTDVPEFAARYDGFEQALRQAGSGKATLLPVHLTSESSYSAIEDYLGGHPSPDGIVAASDVIAMSALRALAVHGKRVPQDVSVVGYDDVLLATHTTPPLTTVRQDVARGAKLMVDMLFRRMEGGEVQSVAMQPELILRGSA
ncbi:DNA-binding LacI/PurR family transcriptional regulator [Novosphingobium hassiacum]|uniref:DNA-binding LacI/PurR family transcriptional regulator n=1 Tax=Novosphingobium hassiacum TaxID=173676 RepID=A0A7W5ZZX4_9SPHN|nr:LacI family DNA-binding transcriptional regulator [Novosphingobium hassiacum]MBB3860730.1 DNA-binding LacI/PurR family transcriptional regulator [Novosphingobium hassiacum]